MTNPATRRRVVITGVGAISPVGLDAETTWASLLAGVSGIGPITRFDATDFKTRFAGEVKGFDPDAAVGKKDARRMDRYCQLGVAAAVQAAENACLTTNPPDPNRTGALIGTGMGAIETIETGMETLQAQGPGRIGPFFMPMMLANMASGHVSMRLNARGPNMATVSACASSAHAIGEAMRWIRDDMADVVYAGGCEAPVSRLSVAGFNAMNALSTRNDDPSARQPAFRSRSGWVRRRGGSSRGGSRRAGTRNRSRSNILAEVAGYGATDDANHIVQPAPEGEGAARAMKIAMADAGVSPADIDYLNAHGTSTPLNEKFETQSIKGAFGEDAYRIAISSTKSMTGHLLGAAGALEAVISTLAIRDQVAPPTINYHTPDPDCDLDYIPNSARKLDIATVMTNSMGFGGHNVSLILTDPR